MAYLRCGGLAAIALPPAPGERPLADAGPLLLPLSEHSHRAALRLTRFVFRRFKSPGSAQRFLAVHAVVGNLFRLGRHLLRAVHYRELRVRAFSTWQQVTCAQ